MPINEPEKVSISPKAMRREARISGFAAYYQPLTSNL